METDPADQRDPRRSHPAALLKHTAAKKTELVLLYLTKPIPMDAFEKKPQKKPFSANFKDPISICRLQLDQKNRLPQQ